MIPQDDLINLLAKYDKPGPRYTSYPTVPAWTSDIHAESYVSSLGKITKGEALSLYFHLPFCEQLCHFCGCMQVITKDQSRSKPYIVRVLREMENLVSHLGRDHEVSQVHFGGGTPNFIKPAELRSLVKEIKSHFQISSDCEWAIEMHPRTSTKEFCETLGEEGFNRISLGVQDFDPTVQKLIHRHQTYKQTADMLALLREMGIKSFNFDLIYGLPGQTLDTWSDTLAKVLDLNPDRLAVYSYAHVPWVRPVQRSFKDEDLPGAETKIRLFEMAIRNFVSHGYDLIGMDHFAKESDELSRAMKDSTIHRNFMGYSTRADAHQIGLGVSSISYVGGNYFQNEKNLKEYELLVDQNKLTTFRGYILSEDDKMRRDLITNIMCQGKIDLHAFEKKWNINFEEAFGAPQELLKEFLNDNLVEIDASKIEVINHGFLFLRNIAMQFDPYLSEISKESTNPTFSRTV